MAITNILLRTLTNADLTTKNAVITWEEEDQNFIEIYEALKSLQNFDVSTFGAYNAGTTYEQDDYVSYNGNIYRFINVTPTAGITPDSDPLYWEIASVGEFAHQQNHDQYLDFGGATQVSASDIYAFINSDLSTYFEQGGNAFGSTAVLGTTDANGLNFITGFGGVLRGGFSATGVFTGLFGLSTDGTASISVDTSRFISYLVNQSTGTGNQKFLAGYHAGLGHNGDYSVAILAALENASGSGLVAIGNGAGAGYVGNSCTFIGDDCGSNGAGDENLIFGPSSAGYGIVGSQNNGVGRSALYLLNGSRVTGFGPSIFRSTTISDAFGVASISNIFWNGHGASGFATLQTVTMQSAMAPDGTNQSAAASIMKHAPALATGNAPSGNIVVQFANIQASGTDRHTLSDGLTFEANTGYIWSATSTSENRLVSGKYRDFSGSISANAGEQMFEYTGSGGDVLTLTAAAGYKGTELTVINNGSGSLTVNGGIVSAGTTLKLISNGTNWL